MPDLFELIARHEAQRPAPIVATPLGLATVAARRLAHILADLPYAERTQILSQLVVNVSAAPMGDTYSLLIGSPPVRDPQIA